jgi:uncharacterized lipoprotein YbaY
MKQAILLAGLAAALVLVGCANKSANTQVAAQPMPEQTAPVHQDLKGEVGSEK